MSQIITSVDTSALVSSLTGDIGGVITPVAGNIDILGGIGTVTTGTPGTITIDATGVDQSNIYYVGKHGNDANDGLTINKAFLTFTAAQAAASAGDVVWCFDDGSYTENITGVANIDIHAPNATLTGAHTVTTNNSWTFKEFIVATATTGITMNTASEVAAIKAEKMTVSGIGIGVLCTSGDMHLRICSIAIENGYFVGSNGADDLHIYFNQLTISGAGTAFSASSGKMQVIGSCVKDIGAGAGTFVSTIGGGSPEISANVARISVDTLSNITATGAAYLITADLNGTLTESGATKVVVGGAARIDDVAIGAITPSTGAFTTLTASTPIGVPSGGTGVGTLTDHGLLLGSGAGALTALGVAANGQIPIGSVGADPVLGNITSTQDFTITNGAGTISMDLTDNMHRTSMHGWNGAIIESPVVTVTSDGATITFSVEKSGGGNLTAIFSTGFYDWTTAPDTIALTAGSDTAPQLNYIYFLESTKTLTKSTVGWPATEHCPVATVICQSAASLQTDGAYKVHAWTDHITSSDEQGHISHLNYWVRYQNATWQSGVAPTLTITPNGGAPDDVIFTSASGTVLQLHDHTFPAFTGTPDVYTVNDSVTPYNVVTDLNALLTDSTGASMSGKYFALVIWGVVSEATGDCKLMVNLPGGSYGTQAQLLADSQKHANFSLPSDFVGTGFLLYQMNLRHQVAGSGTWTSITELDLRGLFPGTAAGGSTSFATEFEDNVFRILDEGDNTKELAFEVSGITTGTTRTITMDDRDIDMDAVATTITTDSGNAVPAAGIAIIAGGANIASSGAGNTVTLALDGVVPIANGGTNASSMATTYGVNYFDGTRLVTTAVGTATHVLTSNGVGVAPTFQAAAGGGVDSVTGGSNINTTGTAADPVVNLDNSPSVSGSVTAGTGMSITTGDMAIVSGKLTMPTTTSADGQITINGTRVFHTYGTENTFVGEGSGNFTLTTGTNAQKNTAIGKSSLESLTTGNRNMAFGHVALQDCTEGTHNACIGFESGANITTGIYNTCLGTDTALLITTGSHNTLLGCTGAANQGAGASLTGSDSDNIFIANLGTAGDNNKIIIGTQGTGDGQQNSCQIAGIYGVTVGGTNAAVLVDNSHVLGTVSSSKRYKDNIYDMDERSSALMDLRPVTFSWKKDKNKQMNFGLIAEEVAEKMPQIVNYDDEGRPDSVRYHDMPAMLLNELQKQRKMIYILTEKIAKLEEK